MSWLQILIVTIKYFSFMAIVLYHYGHIMQAIKSRPKSAEASALRYYFEYTKLNLSLVFSLLLLSYYVIKLFVSQDFNFELKEFLLHLGVAGLCFSITPRLGWRRGSIIKRLTLDGIHLDPRRSSKESPEP